MSQFPASDIFRDSYALAKGGQNRRAIRIGRQKQFRIAGATSRVQRASHFGDPFVSRQQRAARGAHRQLIPLGYARP